MCGLAHVQRRAAACVCVLCRQAGLQQLIQAQTLECVTWPCEHEDARRGDAGWPCMWASIDHSQAQFTANPHALSLWVFLLSLLHSCLPQKPLMSALGVHLSLQRKKANKVAMSSQRELPSLATHQSAPYQLRAAASGLRGRPGAPGPARGSGGGAAPCAFAGAAPCQASRCLAAPPAAA